MYQISLIAAYIAGGVALFAPCCISYLFPAYLGNVFKERKQVLLMTFIYSLGIFVVLMPVVLGAKALQTLFFDLHDTTYLFGGIFMLVVAAISFIGIKIPMPHFAVKQDGQKNDVVSTFTLGIFSGITSACCAPVLIGVVALSSLSPTIIQSIGVGAFYVLGMVTPLYLASLFIHKRNILAKPILKKVITKIKIGSTIYPIFVSNIVATVIFGITGIVMLWLTSTGKLGMSIAESQITKSINNVAFSVSEFVNKIPGLDTIFAIVGIYLLYRFVKSVFNYNNDEDEGSEAKMKYFCPMHKDVVSDKPGKCHKCGGMELVEMKDDKKHEMDHSMHDHSSMMSSPSAASDFLRRFFVVTALLLPLAIFSDMAVEFMGMPDFVGRQLLEFVIASTIFYFGLVFFQHARHEIQMKQYGMMTLVSLGVGAGYLFSVVSTFASSIHTEFYMEIATLIWVLLFGHFLEARSSSAAGDALTEVAKLLPKEAHLKVKDEVSDVDINSLKEGDIVIVKPGEKVPADGVIIKGSGNFNESHISGESKPLKKSVDSDVFAGAISIDGSVEVKLMRVGETSTIGQIKSLIAAAQKTKPSVQKLADRAARWLTFTALGVSLVTLIIWAAIVGESFVFATTLAITVLVIACPHALGLAIPTVSTIATKLAVENGVFIKDMGKIEIIKNATYIVFDKTGTLTKGNFVVTDVITFLSSKFKDQNEKQKSKSNNEKQLLKIVGALESHSSHVIGMAIVNYIKAKKISVGRAENIKNLAGRGMQGTVSGKKYFIGNSRLMKEKRLVSDETESVVDKLSSDGKTPVYVASEEKVLGIIGLSDEIKKESIEAVSQLHKLGIKVAMLTGDTKKAAEPVAKKLGIDSFYAEILPEDKYKHIRELQEKGNIVVMAGDGVNDAPALTQADAGVAIGAGTDVAVEAGDIVLTQSNPLHLVRLIVLSKKVYRKMVENLFWAVGYNVIAIPAAAGLFIPLGFRLTPAIGALLMSFSSVIVVVNAMLLKRVDLEV